MKNNTFDNFLQVYYAQLGSCTYEQSYEKAEKIWTEKNGKRKYKNYNVFKNVVCRFMKERRESKQN